MLRNRFGSVRHDPNPPLQATAKSTPRLIGPTFGLPELNRFYALPPPQQGLSAGNRQCRGIPFYSLVSRGRI